MLNRIQADSGALTKNSEPGMSMKPCSAASYASTSAWMPLGSTHQWNFWPLMSLPLQEARAKVGLLPKLQAGREGVSTATTGVHVQT
jgi:hypothetical protein